MAQPYEATVASLDAWIQAEMRGRSWHPHERCPDFVDLRLLRLPYRDFEGRTQVGELVIAHEVAEEVVDIFARLFEARFPIARMERIDAYDGSDDASMAANNCSAFNFRMVSGTNVLSQHALGFAIDINPVQNPWLRGARIDPPTGAAYLNRDHVRPGMIVRPGPVIDAFEAHGWYWGGDFTDCSDYHHFSKHER